MSTPVPPYGVAIHDAIRSGDHARMQQAASDAEAYLKHADEVRSALAELRKHPGKRDQS